VTEAGFSIVSKIKLLGAEISTNFDDLQANFFVINPLLYGRGVIYPAFFQSCLKQKCIALKI
jgi:hypothetical protein